MKQVSLAVCGTILFLLGVSNAYSLDNNGYIQGMPPAASEYMNPVTLAQNGPAAPVNTGNMGYGKSPLNKLGRGVTNILTFYMEIPASELRAKRKKGDTFTAFFTGTLEGVFTALYRGLTGVCDTITFFAPPYDKPLMRPEFAEQSLSKEADKE